MSPFLRNFLIMCVVLSPLLILFGMILFSGKPEDLRQKENETDKGDGSAGR